MVSILIPAYNCERWIADALRSALAQTWEPKEIIVVDDGSTDGTLAVARRFECDQLRVYAFKNQGAAAARNALFSLSRGDYIQWLDGDDVLAPDKIARQMEVANQCRNKRVVLSSSFGRFKYRHYRADFRPTALWCDLSPIEWLLRKMGQNIYLQTATWLVSRELAESVGPWNTSLFVDDDGEYFCRVLLASEAIRFVPEAKVYYRSPWPRTLSYIGSSDRKISALWRSIQLHISYLRSLEESDRVRTACLTYLQTNFATFYPEKAEIVREIEELAKSLGGSVTPPRLSWKYAWCQQLFGWKAMKTLSRLLPLVRWWALKSWDGARFYIDQRTGERPQVTEDYGQQHVEGTRVP